MSVLHLVRMLGEVRRASFYHPVGIHSRILPLGPVNHQLGGAPRSQHADSNDIITS